MGIRTSRHERLHRQSAEATASSINKALSMVNCSDRVASVPIGMTGQTVADISALH